ncbi:MAG: polyphosphate kinase 2 family protein [Deltaproteobacteria bacterium]|nr:polyphosphate kinase 2 family protein [Deltaproteobacteria bacterium]
MDHPTSFERYRVASDGRFELASIDPRDTGSLDKAVAQERLARTTERIAELQERLSAQDRWAVLLIFQGMDASGKDGTIKQVFASVDPASCQVFAFKAPSSEELDHDFLWRAARALPERGRIGIFNRSYYEEIVTVRIHPEFLEKQRLPPRCAGEKIWDERLEDIDGFERYLSRNGVLVRKFFLHVSKDEQKRRFLERIDEPDKNWKFNEGDVAERARWDDYQHRWSKAIARSSSDHAPWFAVPADKKWFTRLVVAEAVVAGLEELELDFPRVEGPRKQELARAREALEAEK